MEDAEAVSDPSAQYTQLCTWKHKVHTAVGNQVKP